MIIKLDQIHKITIGAILLVLIIIFTRVLAIGNIEPIPFLRISIGPSLIILSSLLLGPIYGCAIGALSDILGIVMFPNNYSINPLFTLVYGLFGLCPWLLYYAIKRIKNEKILFGISAAILLSLCLFVTFFLAFVSDFNLFGTDYHLDLWARILVIVLSYVLSAITMLSIFFIGRYFKKKDGNHPEVNKIAFVAIINNVLWMLILNSIIKTFFFDVSFLIIFFSQAIMFFFDAVVATFVVTYLLLLLFKIYPDKVNKDNLKPAELKLGETPNDENEKE